MTGLSVYGVSSYWVLFHAFYCNFGRAEEYRSLCEVRHKRVPYIGFHCNRQSPDMSLETSALIGSILIRYHLISQDWRGRRCVLIAKMNASFSENIYILWLKYLPRPTVCLYQKNNISQHLFLTWTQWWNVTPNRLPGWTLFTFSLITKNIEIPYYFTLLALTSFLKERRMVNMKVKNKIKS